MNIVILCGGSGTRLWPLSIQKSPKQFSKVIGGQSLFEKTLERNKEVATCFTIIANETQKESCLSQLNKVEGPEVLIEPVGRNTAAAIALAAFNSNPEETLLVLPSDHLIHDQAKYIQALNEATALAKENNIVTFGIQVSRAETGYGYIKANGNEIVEFVEKPSAIKAQEYLDDGNYFWNSGMFCVKAKVYLQELQKYADDIYQAALKTFESKVYDGKCSYFNPELMQSIRSESIDYAIMEHTKVGKIIPSYFEWSDVGSFDSLYEALEQDFNGNTTCSNHTSLDSTNNLILAQTMNIATIGVSDLVVVEYNGSILVAPKNDSQKIKQLVEMLKQKHPDLT